MVKVAVIQYPGSNCDLDALEILRGVVKARTDLVWHKDKEHSPKLEKNHQNVFRYVNEEKEPTEDANPNGSVDNIAGISNQKGNVIGLMPHPERASLQELSPDNQTDGRLIFDSMMRTLNG